MKLLDGVSNTILKFSFFRRKSSSRRNLTSSFTYNLCTNALRSSNRQVQLPMPKPGMVRGNELLPAKDGT